MAKKETGVTEMDVELTAGAEAAISGELPPAITLTDLKKQFGPKKGVDKYNRISKEGGWGDFTNDVGWFPDLATAGLKGKELEAVLKIFQNPDE